MKYYFKQILMYMLFLFVFCMQSNSAWALKDVKFAVYYQSIEEVQQINNPTVEKDDGLWTKAKKYVTKGANAVKRFVEKNVVRNFFPGEGEKTWYSDEDKGKAYKVNRVKVTTEEELMAAMGVKSEDEMSNEQKALLGSFRAAYSDAINERKEYSFLPKVNLILSDTTGYSDDPDVRSDFWSYSSLFTINTSGVKYKNDPNAEANAYSTLIHEYCHSMDLTYKESDAYGLDGSHMLNEITTTKAAFVEGWAEYNQMMESEDKVKSIQYNAKHLTYETGEKDADNNVIYEDIDAEKCDTNQLLACEAVNANILYRMATETENGKVKIYKAFTATRINILRDIRNVIKKFIKQNPEDTETVCKIIDEEFYGKLTNEEFYMIVGETDATRKYVENRHKTTSDANEETIAIETSEEKEATTSDEKVKVDSTSTNPFTE